MVRTTNNTRESMRSNETQMTQRAVDHSQRSQSFLAREQQYRKLEAFYSVAAQHGERISRGGESLPFPDVVHEGLPELRWHLIVRSFAGEIIACDSQRRLR